MLDCLAYTYTETAAEGAWCMQRSLLWWKHLMHKSTSFAQFDIPEIIILLFIGLTHWMWLVSRMYIQKFANKMVVWLLNEKYYTYTKWWFLGMYNYIWDHTAFFVCNNVTIILLVHAWEKLGWNETMTLLLSMVNLAAYSSNLTTPFPPLYFVHKQNDQICLACLDCWISAWLSASFESKHTWENTEPHITNNIDTKSPKSFTIELHCMYHRMI